MARSNVACRLPKAVDGWNDMGLGDFQLGYLRDPEKCEVDFLVARDSGPYAASRSARRAAAPRHPPGLHPLA